MWLESSKNHYLKGKISKLKYYKIIDLDKQEQITLIKYLVTACFLPRKATNKIIARNLINFILWWWDPSNGRWISSWYFCSVCQSLLITTQTEPYSDVQKSRRNNDASQETILEWNQEDLGQLPHIRLGSAPKCRDRAPNHRARTCKLLLFLEDNSGTTRRKGRAFSRSTKTPSSGNLKLIELCI